MRYVPGPRNKPDSTPRQPSELISEPLLVRLTTDVGPLPAEFVYSLPTFQATRLVAARQAIVVGNIGGIAADIVLDEPECHEAGL